MSKKESSMTEDSKQTKKTESKVSGATLSDDVLEQTSGENRNIRGRNQTRRLEGQ